MEIQKHRFYIMRGITKAAKQANGRSRTCAICPFAKGENICPPEIHRICSDAFVEGFKKGVKWLQQGLKEA